MVTVRAPLYRATVREHRRLVHGTARGASRTGSLHAREGAKFRTLDSHFDRLFIFYFFSFEVRDGGVVSQVMPKKKMGDG